MCFIYSAPTERWMTTCQRCASGPPVAMATWRRTGPRAPLGNRRPQTAEFGSYLKARQAFSFGANDQRPKTVYLRPRCARVPGATPVFEDLTSDPKQRSSRSVFGDKRRVPLVGLATCAGAPSVPPEMLTDGCCFLSARRCHRLITSRRGPFTSELV